MYVDEACMGHCQNTAQARVAHIMHCFLGNARDYIQLTRRGNKALHENIKFFRMRAFYRIHSIDILGSTKN